MKSYNFFSVFPVLLFSFPGVWFVFGVGGGGRADNARVYCKKDIFLLQWCYFEILTFLLLLVNVYIFSIIYKHSATQTYLIMRWWLKIINHFYKRAEKKITNLSNILINTHTHSGDILRAYSLFINHIFLHFSFCCLYHIFSRCSNFS